MGGMTSHLKGLGKNSSSNNNKIVEGRIKKTTHVQAHTAAVVVVNSTATAIAAVAPPMETLVRIE